MRPLNLAHNVEPTGAPSTAVEDGAALPARPGGAPGWAALLADVMPFFLRKLAQERIHLVKIAVCRGPLNMLT